MDYSVRYIPGIDTSKLTFFLVEVALRRRIGELQEYRKMGVTTHAESERYERDKNARVGLFLLLYQLLTSSVAHRQASWV